MIEFKIKGVAIDLPPSFVLSLSKKSPVYLGGNMEIVAGTYSVPATIKATDHNRQTFNAPEYLSNWNETLEIENVKLYLDYNHYESGKLYVSAANPDEYKIQFVAAAGALNHLKEKTLNQYEYAPPYAPSEDYATWPNYISATHSGAESAYLLYFVTTRRDLEEVPSTGYYTLSMYVETILKAIFKEENFRLLSDVFDEEELADLLLFKKSRIVRTGNSAEFENLEIKFAEHVPNLIVSTFIKDFLKCFCLGIEINSRTRVAKIFKNSDLLKITTATDLTKHVTSSFQKLINSTDYKVKSFESEIQDPLYPDEKFNYNELPSVVNIGDLSSSAEEGDVCFVYDQYSYYLYDGLAWGNPFQSLHPLTVNNSGAEIKSSIASTWMFATDYDRLFPVTSFPRNFNPSELSIEAEEHGEFLFKQGYATGGDGIDFLLVSNDVYDRLGNKVGKYSTKWFGPDGYYEQHWKKWLQFLNRSVPVECSMKLPLSFIFNFNFLEKIKIWDDHSGGYHYFFFKEFKLVVDMNGVRESKQTLIQIRN